jgi:hypothetical protein
MLKQDRDAGVERVIVSLESRNPTPSCPSSTAGPKLAEKVA